VSSFNNNGPIYGSVNQAAGDQYFGAQNNFSSVQINVARDALRALAKGLPQARLSSAEAASANNELSKMTRETAKPRPNERRVADQLTRLTKILSSSGALMSAGAALIGPIQTLAAWLGTLGAPIRAMLPLS
jgi:hypothetical protein